MERPTRQVPLPICGYTAYVVQYFTRGEKKAVEKAQYQGASIKFIGGDTVFENIAHDFLDLKGDAMLMAGVQKLVNKEGQPQDVNTQFFDSLADSDIQTLMQEVRESYFGKDEDSGKKNS